MSAEDLGRLQGISAAFLKRILAELARAGIVAGVRGHAGGWVLARPPDKVSVAEVMRAVNGPLVNVCGVPPENLRYNHTAEALQHLWAAAEQSLREVLENITIQQLVGSSEGGAGATAPSQAPPGMPFPAPKLRPTGGSPTPRIAGRRA